MNKAEEPTTIIEVKKPIEKPLKNMSDIEIKAVLYDQILITEHAKQNIDVLQAELKNRQTHK